MNDDVKCEEGHEIPCEERLCRNTAEHALCDDHLKSAIKEARDEGYEEGYDKGKADAEEASGAE